MPTQSYATEPAGLLTKKKRRRTRKRTMRGMRRRTRGMRRNGAGVKDNVSHPENREDGEGERRSRRVRTADIVLFL
eukprot:7574324-Pyramimonas_sp.AAC.1